MPRTFTIKDSYFENRLLLNRVVFIFVVIIVLSVGLTGRLVYLQVIGHEHYSTLSQSNRIKIAPLPPTRGLIFDRKGRILAENVPTYSLELVSEQVTDMEATLIKLQKLLNLSDEEITRFHALRTRQKPFTSVPLRLRLSDEEVARFSVNRPHLPGVDIHARLVRNYPYRDITSHVIGYVGRINERELQNINPAAYRGTYHIGKTGIEKTYENTLHGEAGYEEIETNASGRFINVIGSHFPTPGADLYLTLDIDLQKTALDSLGDHIGAVVAIEPETGNVLVFVSKPGFDPNPFVYGISKKAYDSLKTSNDQPLFNRALRGQYPPGSTVKPFIGLAGLEYSATDMHQKLFCPGYYRLPNVSHRYRDWKKYGHGLINLKGAITQSCDVYFYDLAYSLGIDRMYDFLRKFGFGEKTGIDLIGEKSGLLPSREWKSRQRNQPWYPGETLITGIGQGFFQATPLQLAKATATLANRGGVVQPHVVEYVKMVDQSMEYTFGSTSTIEFTQRNLDNIIESMKNVVHGARGTARRIGADIPYKIAGKTGTAQVFTVKQEEKYSDENTIEKLRDHALFIAFAPIEQPQIALAVIVENGGHGGSTAAPIAARIINQYLEDLF